jgi:hypothetical protein
MRKILHILKIFLLSIFFGIIIIYTSLWLWNIFVKELPNSELRFGVTFSKLYAEELQIDWKSAYIAILDDLLVRRIRISAYWSEVEPENGKFNFNDLDFQINEAKKRNVDIIVAIGQKLPRWPECHIPEWVDDETREKYLLRYIETVVNRYKDVKEISYWQIENEPFLKFGVCPKLNINLFNREISLVKSLDSRPIIITDSGEFGDWIRAKKHADVFGTTMYRTIWKDGLGHLRYPLPPTWFKFKDFVSRIFAGDHVSKIIVVEMQAEPWGPDPIPLITIEEQFKYMDFQEFQNNILYAKRAGIPDIYLWGVEWWYWLKETQNDARFWDYARELF